MKVKLLYGKLGQVIELDTFDDPVAGTMGYGRALPQARVRPNQSRPAKAARRGPRFDRVDRLIDQGYYDLGNPAIANEMEILIRDFVTDY